jgi:type II secretory pathway pseudopilin PulG
MNKKGLSRLEIIVIVLIVGILAAILLSEVARRRKVMRRSACVNNLKRIGLALDLYVKENKDRYPPIDDTKNNFIFDANLLYPEYLNNATLAVCPANRERNPDTSFRLTSDHSVDGNRKGEVHADCFTDDSYIYLGWMVMRDKEVEALFETYEKLSPEDYYKDITVPEGWGTLEGDTIHRLFYGVDRFLIKEIVYTGSGQVSYAGVPILWDRPYTDAAQFSHRPASGYILFMDNHAEYQIFDDRFSPRIDYDIYGPVNKTMARLLDERPREPIPGCE